MASRAENFPQPEQAAKKEIKNTPRFTIETKGEELLSRWLKANFAAGVDVDRPPAIAETIDLGFHRFNNDDKTLEEVDAFLVTSPVDLSYGLNMALFPRFSLKPGLKESRNGRTYPAPQQLLTTPVENVPPASFQSLNDSLADILPQDKYTSAIDGKNNGIKFEIKDTSAGIKEAIMIYDRTVLNPARPSYIFSLSQDLDKNAEKFPAVYRVFSELAPLVIQAVYKAGNEEAPEGTFTVEPRPLPRIEALVNKFEATYPVKEEKKSTDTPPDTVSEHILAKDPDKAFSEIVGNTAAKKKIQEITAYIKDPQAYKKMGDIQPPRGLIITGEKGTGKTMLLETLPSETDVNVYLIKGADAINAWGNHADKQIDDIFKQARKQSPSIVAFDNIDLLRANNPPDLAALRTVFSQIDGAKNSGEYVAFIATATNTEFVHPSFFKDERCGREPVSTRMPKPEERMQIFEKKINLLQKKAFENNGGCLFEAIDYEKAGAVAENLTGADIDYILKKLLRERASGSVKAGDGKTVPPVSMKELEREAGAVSNKTNRHLYGKYTYL